MEVSSQMKWHDSAQPLDIRDLQMMGRVMVIAPHQDDESLGCGGTIALLRQAGVPVHVLFITDGSLSHPNSSTYPAPKLTELRESEAISALEVLNVAVEDITFLRRPDGHLPHAGQPGFEETAGLIQQALTHFKPETLLLPWQRDPHPDHRATWQLVHYAMEQADTEYRVLEYLIWLWERAAEEDLPQPTEVDVWKVDISPVKTQKQQAIAAHASQTTGLIDDDPEGFTLSPEVLAHFGSDEEIFVEWTAPKKGSNSLKNLWY